MFARYVCIYVGMYEAVNIRVCMCVCVCVCVCLCVCVFKYMCIREFIFLFRLLIIHESDPTRTNCTSFCLIINKPRSQTSKYLI